MELNDLQVKVHAYSHITDLKKIHDIYTVLIFRVLLNVLSFYLNKWNELNLIEKDEPPKFSDW